MYKNKTRIRSFEQLEINKDEVRQYLSEHNYKICDSGDRRFMLVSHAWHDFNNWSNIAEKIKLFDFTMALKSIAMYDYKVIPKEKTKLINGKQQKILTNIYIKPTF